MGDGAEEFAEVADAQLIVEGQPLPVHATILAQHSPVLLGLCSAGRCAASLRSLQISRAYGAWSAQQGKLRSPTMGEAGHTPLLGCRGDGVLAGQVMLEEPFRGYTLPGVTLFLRCAVPYISADPCTAAGQTLALCAPARCTQPPTAGTGGPDARRPLQGTHFCHRALCCAALQVVLRPPPAAAAHCRSFHRRPRWQLGPGGCAVGAHAGRGGAAGRH